eukprot:gnl/TRDRNA2_/TRDRNA2_168643_c0_seq4.p1 gnl/TRDRNA2_/TRDRNA2_168643_c0~~gnl/TRDRNA2_/TRDRNA2_168643_c0_seq4.p1  ORF type:complete len:174 (+),score=13.51 gnl/TRDRNA2_/TRDRNA2_168643_c0_seq4:399-920(+)
MENDCRNSQHFDLTTFLPDVDLTLYNDLDKRLETEQVKFNWTWRRASFLSSMCLPDIKRRLETLMLYDRMFDYAEHPTLMAPYHVTFGALNGDVKHVLLTLAVVPFSLITRVLPDTFKSYVLGRKTADPARDFRLLCASLVDSAQAFMNEFHRRKSDDVSNKESILPVRLFED